YRGLRAYTAGRARGGPRPHAPGARSRRRGVTAGTPRASIPAEQGRARSAPVLLPDSPGRSYRLCPTGGSMQRSWILALTAVAVLAACDDDPAASEGDPMSQAEALSIAGNVMLTGEAATTEGIVQATENGDEAGTIHFTQTTTHPCPSGGLVEVSLDADVEYDQGAQSFTLDATGAVAHDGCGVN